MMGAARGEQALLHPCSRGTGGWVVWMCVCVCVCPVNQASPVARGERGGWRTELCKGQWGPVSTRCCWLWAGEGKAVLWLGRAKGCFGVHLQSAVMKDHVHTSSMGLDFPCTRAHPYPMQQHPQWSPSHIWDKAPLSAPSCSRSQPPPPTSPCS